MRALWRGLGLGVGKRRKCQAEVRWRCAHLRLIQKVLLQQVGLSGDLGDLAPVGAAVLAANVAAAGVVVFRGSERPAFAALRALVGGPLVLLEEGGK